MSYSILIVDDSLPMRAVIKRTLGAAGYGSADILEASNGNEALKLMERAWIDLIMTDYNMPEMNGLEFVKKIKSKKLFEKIPVVVISTEGNHLKIKEFLDAGAAGYITKPFTPESVRNVIVDILGEVAYEEDFDESDDEFDF